jgi:hypothetical protein
MMLKFYASRCLAPGTDAITYGLKTLLLVVPPGRGIVIWMSMQILPFEPLAP